MPREHGLAAEASSRSGLFDRQREARRILLDIYRRKDPHRLGLIASSPGLKEWEAACDLLRNHATPEQAAKDANAAYIRMKYFQVPEPQPVLEQFLPPHPPSYLDSAMVLAEAQHRFEAARSAHKYRERLRLKELEAARSLYLRLQLAMWPQGVTLDPDVAAIEGIERQVDTQNTRIERQVGQNPTRRRGPRGRGAVDRHHETKVGCHERDPCLRGAGGHSGRRGER